MTLLPSFPDFWPVGKYSAPAPEGFIPKPWNSGKSHPDIQKMPDGDLIIGRTWYQNFSKETGKVVETFYRLDCWKKKDHPNLYLLPKGTPRSVTSLYKADFQLYFLRMSNCADVFKRIDQAYVDWKIFCDNSSFRVFLIAGRYLKFNKVKGNIMNEVTKTVVGEAQTEQHDRKETETKKHEELKRPL